MAEWFFKYFEVREGFLSGVKIDLSSKLTCIIGPRGSGKSTLANALRFSLQGIDGADKQRQDLFRANLAKAVLIARASRSDGSNFSLRREGREAPILTSDNGEALSTVDLDRGTFLPLDAYSAGEIEDIADEQLGSRRRTLLDQLNPSVYRTILDEIAEAKRQLNANADKIKGVERELASQQERLISYSGAQERLVALGQVKSASPEAEELQIEARQEQINLREAKLAQSYISRAEMLSCRLAELSQFINSEIPQFGQGFPSRNQALVSQLIKVHADLIADLEARIKEMTMILAGADREMRSLQALLLTQHTMQAGVYAKLREVNEAVGRSAKERAELEQGVATAAALRESLVLLDSQLKLLVQERAKIRANFLGCGEKLSAHRASIATALQKETGARVRIKLRRSADLSEYVQKLNDGLKGAGVSRHESIVDSILTLRPDELAQLISTRNYSAFESSTGLEADRARRVLDSFRTNIDPFELELIRPDDLVAIELNVGKAEELFKDAAHLSQGQKCTALLPLLLARRTVPLIIDQPEDNLDNHFIYETVVKSILKMKEQRQMIFVTHNANIPVLAEAEMIIVLGSDGKSSWVEKFGSVDECRTEIIDLLEGGEEAFSLRQKRYHRG